MKVYVQFLTTDTSGDLCESVGSDGVFILDGRNTLETWKADAEERIHRLRFVQTNIVGYRIMKGDRIGDSKMVFEFVQTGIRRKKEKK